MKRFSVALTLLLTAIPSPAFPDTDPLSLIPADSAVVVRIKAPQSTVKAVAGFVEQVQPGAGPLIQAQATPLLGAALQNVTLAGIDLSRDIYVVLNVAEGKPQGFMLVPASDAGAVKESTGAGQGYQFVEADGWVASSVHSLEAVQACIDGNAKSINDSLSKDTLRLLGNGHLGVALQAAPLRSGMAKELQQAQAEFDEFITMMSTQLTIAAPAGTNLDGIVDIYRFIGECVFQVIDDSSSAAVSVSVSNEALTIEESLTVTGGSRTGQLLAANHPGTMEGITSLPEGLLAYMGFHGNFEVLLELSEKLASSLYEGENGEKMNQAMRHFKDAGIASYFAGIGLNSGNGGLLQAAGRARLKNGDAVRKSLKVFGEGFELNVGTLKQKITYRHDAETIGDEKITIQHLTQEMPAELDPLGMQRKMNELMYGPDGFTQRLAVRDRELLQTVGGGKAAMESMVKGTKNKDTDLLETLGRLGGDSNLLAVADIPNSLRDFGKLVLAVTPAPVAITKEQLDNLEIAPSWAGFSVTASENQVTAKTHIPIETIQGVTRLTLFLVQQVNGTPAVP